MQSERGLPMGRPLQTPLALHGSWLPAGALLVAHLVLSVFGQRPLTSAVPIAAATVAAYAVCMVIHTLAHLILGRITGVRATSARIFIFGDVSSGPTSGAATIAGPVASALIAGGCYLASTITTNAIQDGVRALAFANAGVAVINLVPVLPFDVGRLVAVSGRRRFALFGGRVFGVAAMACGVWLVVASPVLVERAAAGVWLALVGLFVVIEARAAQPDHGRLPQVNGVAVGEWTRPFAGRVDAHATVPVHGGPYAVSEDGRLAGVLVSGGRERVLARDVMIPWTSDLKLPEDAPLARGLERLATGKAPLIVVVDRSGVVRGILDEQAVRSQLGGI